MATADDYDGVFFSIQALRISNIDRLDELEFIVIDNRPDSAEGKATKDICQKTRSKYIENREWRSTASRDLVFRNAESEWVLCMDPHVLLEPNTIPRILKFIEDNPTANDLYGGALLYDEMKNNSVATNFKPVWRSQMYGIWESQPRGADPNADPFEIPMHGLGLFMQRKSAWQGFNPLFLGFGGEEGYIHEKTRRAGARNILLPWLRWNHRFERPRGVPYPLVIEERISNYMIGWIETEQNIQDVHDHFTQTAPGVDLQALQAEVDQLLSMDLEDAIRRRRAT